MDDQEQKQQSISPPEETLAPIAFGYSVGVDTNGQFVFQLLGEDKGIVQLLGLNKFAETQLNSLMDANLRQGDTLLLEAISQVYKKLDQLQQLLPNSTV
jgi:hypothetical protein